MTTSSQNQQNENAGGLDLKSNVLFKGDSCYPLSPRILTQEYAAVESIEISDKDQLLQIAKVMGNKPNTGFDLTYVEGEKPKEQVKTIEPHVR